MSREPDLFEAERAKERRVLVGLLNKAVQGRKPARLPDLPAITVPGLDPATGHRRRKSPPRR